MSATAYPQGNHTHIVSITGGSSPAVNESEPLDSLPCLPHVSSELEKYFSVARRIEASLTQQKLLCRRYEEELRELQLQYSKLASDSDNRIRDYLLREDRLKSQLNTQVSTYQQTEKVLQNQISELSRQLERERDQRKKSELDSEILRANLDYMKQREESLNNMIKTLQEGEKARTENIAQHSKQLQSVIPELNRYKAAWAQVLERDKRAKEIIFENPSLRSRIDDLKSLLENEKKRNESAEEFIKRERREKRAALTCLHTAESKLNQAYFELEQMKKRYEENVQDVGFELKI
jgi:chromosome segregation ATPase